MASVEVVRGSVSPRGQISLRGQIFLVDGEPYIVTQFEEGFMLISFDGGRWDDVYYPTTYTVKQMLNRLQEDGDFDTKFEHLGFCEIKVIAEV